MKKIIFTFIAFTLVVGICTEARAAYMSSIKFYVVDINGGGVTLDAFDIGVTDLEWSYTGVGDWKDWGGGTSVSQAFSVQDGGIYQSVYLRNNLDNNGIVTFLGGGASGNANWFSGATIDFGAGIYSFQVTQGDDAVSNVPIAPSAVLLGSGLLGLLLLGVRRRTQRE